MKKCPVQSGTLWATTVTSRMGQFQRLFTRKPASVSLDFSISSDACRLYDILCIENYKSGFRTNLVTVTTRSLAELTGKSRTTVSRWLSELRGGGHLEKVSRHGQALTYRLSSPVYDFRAVVETMPGAAAEVSSKDLVLLRDKKRKCLKCGKVSRIASTSGACDSCLAEWIKRLASA